MAKPKPRASSRAGPVTSSRRPVARELIDPARSLLFRRPRSGRQPSASRVHPCACSRRCSETTASAQPPAREATARQEGPGRTRTRRHAAPRHHEWPPRVGQVRTAPGRTVAARAAPMYRVGTHARPSLRTPTTRPIARVHRRRPADPHAGHGRQHGLLQRPLRRRPAPAPLSGRRRAREHPQPVGRGGRQRWAARASGVPATTGSASAPSKASPPPTSGA